MVGEIAKSEIAPSGYWVTPKKKKDEEKWKLAKVTNDRKNKEWAENKSNFGYKMLLKMGWTDGKGLGAKEDGQTEHIEVEKRDDNAGVGAEVINTSNNWLQNSAHYHGVLEKLNKAYRSTGSDSQSRNKAEKKDKKRKRSTASDSEKKRSKKRKTTGRNLSVEAAPRKSKTKKKSSSKRPSHKKSKRKDVEEAPVIEEIAEVPKRVGTQGRHFYKKFREAKDVSKYSSEDMACIFGGLPVTTTAVSSDSKDGRSSKQIENMSTSDDGVNEDDRKFVAASTCVESYFSKPAGSRKAEESVSSRRECKKEKRSHSKKVKSRKGNATPSKPRSQKNCHEKKEKKRAQVSEVSSGASKHIESRDTEVNSTSWNDWSSLANSSFSGTRREKFLHLMGASKSATQTTTAATSSSSFMSSFVSSSDTQSVLEKEDHSSINKQLEDQFNSALNGQMSGRARGGLGFQKKGAINIHQVRAVKLS